MIWLYSGTPGSGKSLHMAHDILDRARTGKPVIGNFPVYLEKYKRANYTYVDNGDLTPDFLVDYSKAYFSNHRFKEGTILLIIDECQLLFNAREWQKSGRDQWLSFFTQHRKYGYNIILVAQFDRMIDRQIRSLIEYEYVHRKISNFGFAGSLFSLLSGGKLFISVERWYPLKEKIGSHFFKCKKKFYRIYDSYTTFDAQAAAGGAGDQGPQQNRLQYEVTVCTRSQISKLKFQTLFYRFKERKKLAA